MTRCEACGCAITGAQDPTKAEARMLQYVLAYHHLHGRFPKYHTIRVGLRLGSLSHVYAQIRGLERKGWITTERYRGIKAARGPE